MRTSEQVHTGTVRSNDGTAIAYERVGEGPALVLVDAAGHHRGFSSFGGLIELLAPRFTVYHYDRRGRGDSGDTAPYAVAREVEDLAALIAEAGGSAFVHAYSSGCLLAAHAAADGLPIRRLALLEPPIATEEERAEQRAFTAALVELVAAGHDEAVVEHYLTGIGVPEEMLAGMRGTPPWSAMVEIAPTLVHDSLISEATSSRTLAAVTVPTLVVDSEGSGDDLTGMAATVARAIPDASHRSLPGAWHGVAADVLAPLLIAFFGAA